jgi:hypothetical protein
VSANGDLFSSSGALENQKIPFSVSPSIVKHLIRSQSGSISKSILELVSNSLDAKARKVQILISDDFSRIEIIDDGVGFKSMEEVEQLFGTLGFDHTTEREQARARDYGRFGIGRLQCLNFGRCRWISNEFSMMVDVNSEENSSDGETFFQLEPHDHCLHKGCKVVIDLYNTLSVYDFNNLKREISSQLKYVSSPIFLNGRQLTSLDSIAWTFDGGDASFLKASGDSTRGLSVYNQGIYVQTFRHSAFGVSGDVNSKVPILLNMARNDVLTDQCETWKSIKKQLEPFSIRRAKKRSLSYDDANVVIMQWLAGELESSAVLDKALFLSINGRRNTLEYLSSFADGKITVSQSDQSQIGESVHRDKLCWVMAPKQLSDLGFSDLNELLSEVGARMEAESSLRHRVRPYGLKVVDFASFAKAYAGGCRVLDTSKLSLVGQLRLKALESINHDLVNQINVALGLYWNCPERIKRRRFLAGESKQSLAFTDSDGYICVNKEFLAKSFSGSANGIANLLNVLVHEYCHNASSHDDHTHGRDFYLRFHDIVTSEHYKPLLMAESVIKSIVGHRQKSGLELSQQEIKCALDESLKTKILA